VLFIIGAIVVIIAFFLNPYTQSKHSGIRSKEPPKSPQETKGVEYLKNKRDLWIYTKKWDSPNPRAIVFLYHGLAEHCGVWEHVANEALQHDLSVYCLDFTGHGRSEGDRGYVEEFNDFVEDGLLFVEKERKSTKSNIPFFLFGHSNGGTVAILTGMKSPDLFKGIILSAPAIIADPSLATPFLIAVSDILSRYLPKLRIAAAEPSKLSRDLTYVKRITEDELYNSGAFPARYADSALKTFDIILNNMSNIEWPVLLLQGTADLLIQPSGTQLFYDTIQSKDKSLKKYDGYYHDIFNEIGKEKVIQDMISWIQAHV